MRSRPTPEQDAAEAAFRTGDDPVTRAQHGLDLGGLSWINRR